MISLALRKTLALSIPVLVAVCAVAILPSALSARAVDQDADAKALTKLDEDWSKAAGTKDAEKVASFCADDAIAYPPNQPAAVGRPAVKQLWATMLALPELTIAWKPVHVETAASGDLGVTAGTYALSFKGPDAKTVAEKGKYVCTWKKQKDGTWKAIHDIWNSDSK